MLFVKHVPFATHSKGNTSCWLKQLLHDIVFSYQFHPHLCRFFFRWFSVPTRTHKHSSCGLWFVHCRPVKFPYGHHWNASSRGIMLALNGSVFPVLSSFNVNSAVSSPYPNLYFLPSFCLHSVCCPFFKLPSVQLHYGFEIFCLPDFSPLSCVAQPQKNPTKQQDSDDKKDEQGIVHDVKM